jgi:hypothetical protein
VNKILDDTAYCYFTDKEETPGIADNCPALPLFNFKTIYFLIVIKLQVAEFLLRHCTFKLSFSIPGLKIPE